MNEIGKESRAHICSGRLQLVASGVQWRAKDGTAESAQLYDRLDDRVGRVGVVARQHVAAEEERDQARIEEELVELGRRLEPRHARAAAATRPVRACRR